MKVFQIAALLVLGTVMATFSSVALAVRVTLFSKPVSFSFVNPTLLVEAIGISGLAFIVMALRMLYVINKELPGNAVPPSG